MPDPTAIPKFIAPCLFTQQNMTIELLFANLYDIIFLNRRFIYSMEELFCLKRMHCKILSSIISLHVVENIYWRLLEATYEITFCFYFIYVKLFIFMKKLRDPVLIRYLATEISGKIDK